MEEIKIDNETKTSCVKYQNISGRKSSEIPQCGDVDTHDSAANVHEENPHSVKTDLVVRNKNGSVADWSHHFSSTSVALSDESPSPGDHATRTIGANETASLSRSLDNETNNQCYNDKDTNDVEREIDTTDKSNARKNDALAQNHSNVIQSDINSICVIQSQPESQLNGSSPCLLEGGISDDSIGNISDCEIMLAPPQSLSFYCPPGLEGLTEVCQVLIHQGNFRYPDIKVQDSPRTRMEIIDITKKLICIIEEAELPFGEDSFLYKGYNKDKEEVLQIYNPGGSTCLVCGFSMHCLHSRRCYYQVMVQAPVGNIVGFIKRTHTWLMQEYYILNSQEEHLLTLRGGPVDLEVYTPDLDTGLGRISRQWVGIMRELSRSRQDFGLSFPMDLDVRVKAVLIGAVVSINWLYFKSHRQRRADSSS